MATGTSSSPAYLEVFGKSIKDQLLVSGGSPIIISWDGTSDEFFHLLRTHVGLPVYIGEVQKRSPTTYDFLLKLDSCGEISTAMYEMRH